jgi:hypothetical protein
VALGLALSPARREARGQALVLLGALRLAGVLAEPATWGRRRSRVAMAVNACHAAVAVTQVLVGLRTRPAG